MGVLKHVVCPLFAVLHAASIYACRDLHAWAEMVELQVENPEVASQEVRQLHMLGVLRGFNVAFCLLSVLGSVSESAHFRGVLALAYAALYGTVALDAYSVGVEGWMVPAVIAVVATVGLLIHSNEPGIFTKDKGATAKSD